MFGDSLAMTSTKKTQAGHGHGYPKHQHELELQSDNKRFTCDGCKEQGFGPRHRCERCDYDLHKGAVDNINSRVLEKMDLRQLAVINSNRNGGRGNESWRTVENFLRTIVVTQFDIFVLCNW
ncbi:hypothetical protein F0562_026144 [Nyssa sinensis]|uniref:DC1 domain-containing protein n=1 Tax=Nyssa sinensis TaxID=561372 RepID=A0A5J5BC53_9ASTE|nr:hypothetical protein F0562_026144 [Nyssa sinensis]